MASHVFWGIFVALFGGLHLSDGTWYGDNHQTGVAYVRPLVAVAIVVIGVLAAVGFFGAW